MGGFLSKINKALGKGLNDITGATSAAELNNDYQRYFAENAHQMEVKDLEAAGINPILASGSGGNTASGGGTSGSAGISPITEAIGVLTGITSAQKANADAVLAEKQTEEVDATINEKNANTANKNADTLLKTAQELSQKLDNEIKAGAKEETIQNTKLQLEETWSRITKNNAETLKTEEEAKRIMMGWLGDKLGTAAFDMIDEQAKKAQSAKRHYLYKNTDGNNRNINGYSNFGFKGIYGGYDPTKIWQ